MENKPCPGDPEEVETLVAFYDVVEEHDNCHVQVLRNSQTGEVSVGWWPNSAEPAAETGAE